MLNETKLQDLLEIALTHKENHQCSANPYQFGGDLSRLVHTYKPMQVLEIGTGAGFSTLVMALTHPGSHIDTIDKDDAHIETAKQHFHDHDVNTRINPIQGTAESLLPILNKAYDFIFFDGYGIHYEYLPNYHRLLKPTGILTVANNHLGSRTSDQFFSELNDPSRWTIIEVFGDTTVAKKAN